MIWWIKITRYIKWLSKYLIQQFKISITLKSWYFYKIKLYFSFRKLKQQLHPSEFEKHCLITGMTWSWKSELLKYLIHLFINTKKNKASIIVCDPHGDVADEIFSHKYINHNDVVYFNSLLFGDGAFGISDKVFKSVNVEGAFAMCTGSKVKNELLGKSAVVKIVKNEHFNLF